MTDTGHASNSTAGRMACAFCRRRKLKCNKELPKCQSCLKFGFDCEYVTPGTPGGMKKLEGERSSRVRQLESRLGRVEQLLRAKNQRQGQNSTAVSSGAGTVKTESDEVSLDDGTATALEHIYFEFVHPAVNIIHPERYVQCRPPTYLQHAIYAVSAAITEDYAVHREGLYKSSRKLLQEAELQDKKLDSLSLAHAQSWILIAFYEILQGYFHRAWMSSSRAVRLVQMMKLHRIDAVLKTTDPSLVLLDAAKDLTEVEERRRIFWMTFLMDRYSCISMGWPTLIDERDIRTYLPISNEAFANSVSEQRLFLSQAKSAQEPENISTFACQVVLSSLCGNKLSELQRFDPNVPATQPLRNAWLKPQRLNDPLTTIFCVPQYLTSRPTQLTPASVFLDIFAAATTICVHRAAQSQVREDPVSAEMIAQSRKQCLEVSFSIFRLMEMTCHWDLRVFYLCFPFCLYNAVTVFASFWLEQEVELYERPLRFLIKCIDSFKNMPLATILLADVEAEFPGLIDRLNSSAGQHGSSDNTEFAAPIQLQAVENFSASDPSLDMGFNADFGDTGSFDQLYGAETWEIDDSILSTMGALPPSSFDAWNNSLEKGPDL
ncbi:hypothetical protein ONS95_007601 [Cadophora gregata]|uniref:uncharacterized protein n=1 Tax=Cadophora gregata TaxID=51156 RepID=UPI0026DAF4AA|nr:uncharacterized protein ONS95_007601 [Cadophora gregata]KAK0118715.1 hypothetical protein ONS96_011803 [Cadophora gregata f. sp. sojae]KAK0125978.1 hypothetical protein ONS95_007601 [Cadophora gregata]